MLHYSVRCQSNQELVFLVISYIIMLAAMDTLRLSIWALIGIFTNISQFFLTKSLSPLPSDPIITAILLSKSFWLLPRVSVALPSVPIIQKSSFFRSFTMLEMFVISTRGTMSNAPLAAFATTPFSETAPSFGYSTASTPKAAADLKIEPRFCGSVTLSNITIFERFWGIEDNLTG